MLLVPSGPHRASLGQETRGVGLAQRADRDDGLERNVVVDGARRERGRQPRGQPGARQRRAPGQRRQGRVRQRAQRLHAHVCLSGWVLRGTGGS
jgi:hypothetical protein